MKRWLIVLAAIGITVGVAGPVAAKSLAPKAPAAAKVAVKPAAPKSPVKTAAPVTPKHDRGGGGYPGPTQAKVYTDPSSPRRGYKFKVKVEYFPARCSVNLDLSPSQTGWPKSLTTDRYGKGSVYITEGLSAGNYTVTATCSSTTASKSFRVK